MGRKHTALLKTLGANIKKHRKALGISQEQLAETAGVSRDYLARIEVMRDSPSLGVLDRIAGALGVSPAELLLNTEEQHISRAERLSTMLSNLSDDDAAFVEEQMTNLVLKLSKKSPPH
ncbi:MAG: helix-turn-helix domain-containing protein [Armatimonadota bacterium]